MDFGLQNGFLDFKVDFWVSKWISGFQCGFLDFEVNFWISKWISGFQADFWISFEPAIILKIQLKYTHDSLAAFLSAYWLTEYKVTGTSPLHSAQDFRVDFRISERISGFQSGFLDFRLNFWISQWISGFQFGFLPTVYEISFRRDEPLGDRL